MFPAISQQTLPTGLSAGVFGMAFGVFLVLAVWSLFWKGMALWKAAQKGSKVWFVVLLIVNTLGILEILYLYVFSREAKSDVPAPKTSM